MIYILMIWTVVGVGAADRSPNIIKHDWRPLGEFQMDTWERKYNAKQMCERAAQELGLKIENYRCVRSK
jgi:hypothetical protein